MSIEITNQSKFPPLVDAKGNFVGQIFQSTDATCGGRGIAFQITEANRISPKIGEYVKIDDRVWVVSNVNRTGFSTSPFDIVVGGVRTAFVVCAEDWIREKLPLKRTVAKDGTVKDPYSGLKEYIRTHEKSGYSDLMKGYVALLEAEKAEIVTDAG